VLDIGQITLQQSHTARTTVTLIQQIRQKADTILQ